MAGVGRKSRAACVHMFLPGVDEVRTNRVRDARFSTVDRKVRANKIPNGAARKRRHILFGRADYCRAAAAGLIRDIAPDADLRARNLAFERGEGVWLVATDGERYLDFTSGVAVNALGHAHPHLVADAQRAGGKAVARLQSLRNSRRRTRRTSGSAMQALPTWCSSAIPAPKRWNARSRRHANTNR